MTEQQSRYSAHSGPTGGFPATDDSIDLSALKQQHSGGHGPCGCLQPATCTSAKYLAIVERQQQDAAGLRVQLASALQRWEHAVREWDDLQRRWDAAEREGAEWRTVAEGNQELLTRVIEKLSTANRERDLALGELAATLRERLRAIEWDEATTPPQCAWCLAPRVNGHEDGCKFAALLAAES